MYIRTKDGVYEELDTTEQGVWTIYGKFIENNEILKQSEDLDLLCDEFVLHNDNTTKLWLYEPYDLINEYLREGINHRYIIYGAIWTDKGLIYVAKMNDKGELELI